VTRARFDFVIEACVYMAWGAFLAWIVHSCAGCYDDGARPFGPGDAAVLIRGGAAGSSSGGAAGSSAGGAAGSSAGGVCAAFPYETRAVTSWTDCAPNCRADCRTVTGTTGCARIDDTTVCVPTCEACP